MNTVSVILLHYYGCESTVRRAVQSVVEQTYREIELILVDNGTGQLKESMIASVTSAVARRILTRLVSLPANVGFARGMNAGLSESTGDIIIFLNCDAFLDPRFVERATRFLESHSDIGTVAACVWRWTNTDVSPRTGRGMLDAGPVNLRFDMRVVTPHLITEVQPCFKPNGACPVFRRSVLDAITEEFGREGYEPAFDTFGEDVDLGFKVATVGYETAFVPEVEAFHVRSATTDRRMWNRKSRFRINSFAARYLNALCHLSVPSLLVVLAALIVEDLALVTWLTLRRADKSIAREWIIAVQRVAALRGLIRASRASHRRTGRWGRLGKQGLISVD